MQKRKSHSHPSGLWPHSQLHTQLMPAILQDPLAPPLQISLLPSSSSKLQSSPPHTQVAAAEERMAYSSPRSSYLLFLSFCLSAALFLSGASAATNITGILEKSGQFSVLIKLLSTTQVGNQLTNEINNSFQGLTLLAPNDGAFNSLQSGFLNDLSQENQVKLLMFHVLSKFYTWDDFRSVSNPVLTQASGPDGPYGLNFTYISNLQVNVSSGAVTTTFTNAVNLTKPLAVYEINKVLYPKDKFIAAPAPTPSSSEKNATAKAEAPSSGSSSSKGSSDASSKSAAASVRGQWSTLMGSLLVVMGTASIVFLL